MRTQLGFFLVCCLICCSATSQQNLPLIPWPQRVDMHHGAFPIALPFDFTSIDYELAPELGAESYILEISDTGIAIRHGDSSGKFYATKTLSQLLPPQGTTSDRFELPTLTIEDRPAFPWRGMHLDVARHFMSMDHLKLFIDVIAGYKFNRFHWHLTDDQGWRIEIKQYPRLTTVGGCRDQTLVGHGTTPADEQRFDGKPHCGWYTQEQIKELVAYAAERHITVVPEIEFPGHAQAAITAYPELGNTGESPGVMQNWGVSVHTVNPSDETLRFFQNVLSEVMDLFPSRHIHIGGDEARKDQWRASESAQRRIADLGLDDEDALQSWLISQLDSFLTEHGRTLVGWDEILEGGLSPNATVMSWRGMSGGIEAAEAGHDVVMAPWEWTYFDHYQAGQGPDEPLALGGYLPLSKVYSFNPVPDQLSTAARPHILGGQGQLWSEYISTPAHMQYMAFPRSIALAEVLWTGPGGEFDEFSSRLDDHLPHLDARGVNYRPPGNDGMTIETILHIADYLWSVVWNYLFGDE